ncbi:tellurite resistance/C4-dicarboxylate transporter family protein [Yinghuangia sp. YIM S09857]|uniref:tellurite resistance/C4-dicarboxylate transporter family protein n=1 Tax=Yinghuangia sp. YIM S09857 TaxID=3436929 RepID=UPI003F53C9B5
MSTAIVSIGMHLTGFEVLSKALLALAGVAWVVLACAFGLRVLWDRPDWRTDADTPPALTAVAATSVLGTRIALLGRHGVASALLVVAAAVWPFLLLAVIRHWQRRGMPGVVFLVCVATQGLAVLAGTLGPWAGEWLMWVALCLFALGIALYVDALLRFDFRQILTGPGDHWIAGGALAISTVAGSKLVASTVWTGWSHTVLRTTTLVLLALAAAWYAVLAVGEVWRPRPQYNIRRWSTVFPLGMTAVAGLSVSASAGVAWLDRPSRVLLWIAAAVWLLVLVGLVRSLGRREDRDQSGGGQAERHEARTA